MQYKAAWAWTRDEFDTKVSGLLEDGWVKSGQETVNSISQGMVRETKHKEIQCSSVEEVNNSVNEYLSLDSGWKEVPVGSGFYRSLGCKAEHGDRVLEYKPSQELIVIKETK